MAVGSPAEAWADPDGPWRRHEEGAGAELAVLRLPARVTAVAQARAVARAAFSASGVSRGAAEDGVLAVCELVTNALTHASGPFELRVRCWAGAVVCEVLDGDATLVGFPELDAADEDGAADDQAVAALALGGRGLGIVRRLSGGWCGCRLAQVPGADGGVGKAVWFALPVGRAPMEGLGGQARR